MMTVSLGGKTIAIDENDENKVLSDLLKNNGYTDLHFAVAVNRQFIPRIDYIKTILRQDDVIDIITPMQGG